MSLPATYGALLLGSLIASALSGAVVIHTILYFKVYPSDPPRLKVLVVLIWFSYFLYSVLDTCHTSFIWSALWAFCVKFYGQIDKIDYVPQTLALSVIVTATLTFCVHCFFALRLFRCTFISEPQGLSKTANEFVVASYPPQYTRVLLANVLQKVILALLRLGTAAASTAELLILHSLSEFVDRDGWIFTLGLSSSSAVDVIITASLVFYLRKSGRGSLGRTSVVIDTLIKYTFETASLTSASTIICMICWVTMPSNLIFMGLHFFIGKRQDLFSVSFDCCLQLYDFGKQSMHYRSWSH
uniref:DUF6534 domain-containing protein n=2 Tax=Moniliophthora roreri TaxID=221103 RepID=A0A0W0F8S9_MONRR